MATLAELQINVDTDAVDRADRKLRRLARAASRSEKRVGAFGATTSHAARDVDRTAAAQNKLAGATGSVSTNTKEATGLFDRMKRSLPVRIVSSMVDAMQKMRVRARLLIGSLGILIGVVGSLRQEMVALAAVAGGVLVNVQLEPVRRRLEQITDSTEEFAQQMQMLSDIANEAGVRLTAIGPAAADIAAASQAAGNSMAETRTIIGGFTQGLRNLGLGTDDITSKLEEVAGVAKQDEVTLGDLRSLVENTADPTQTLADALGMSVQELQRFEDSAVATGDALAAVGQQFREQTEGIQSLSVAFSRFINKLTTQLSDVFNQAGVLNALEQQIRSLTQYLSSPEATGVLEQLGNAVTKFINTTLPNLVSSMRQHWDAVVKTVKVAVGAMVGLMVGSGPGALVGGMLAALDAIGPIATGISSAIQGLIKNFELFGSILEGIGGVIVSIFVAKGVNAAIPALRTFAVTVGSTAASLTGMTAKFGPATMAMQGFSAATSGTVTAVGKFKRFLGGLPGLITSVIGIVGSLVVSFRNYKTEAEDTADSTRTLAQEVETLTARGKELQTIKLQEKFLDVSTSMDDATERVSEAQSNIKRLRGEIQKLEKQTAKGAAFGKQVARQRELKSARQALEKYQTQLANGNAKVNHLTKLLNELSEAFARVKGESDASDEYGAGLKKVEDAAGGAASELDRMLSKISEVFRQLESGRIGDVFSPVDGGQGLLATDEARTEQLRRQLNLTKEQFSLMQDMKENTASRAEELANMNKLLAQGQVTADQFFAQQGFGPRDQNTGGGGGGGPSLVDTGQFQSTGRQMDAVLENAARLEQAGGNINKALGELPDNLEKSAQSMEFLNSVSNNLSSGLAKMATDAETTFDDIAKSFGQMLLRMALQQTIRAGLSASIGTAQAKGGVWDNGVQKFASGGIVNQPTMFGMANGGTGVMGEAGTEAIMPVSRTSSGELGVKGAAPNVNVENNVINNSSDADARTETQQRSDGTLEIRTIVEDQVDSSIRKGKGRRAVQDTFGIKPSGTRRS